MVLFVGRDCLIFENTKEKKPTITRLDKKIDLIIIITSLFSLSLTLVKPFSLFQ